MFKNECSSMDYEWKTLFFGIFHLMIRTFCGIIVLETKMFSSKNEKRRMNLVDIKRSEYKRALEMGFKPKYNVSHSVSKRHYFLSDIDYEALNKIVNARIVESVRK